jgi:hypothetical protein
MHFFNFFCNWPAKRPIKGCPKSGQRDSDNDARSKTLKSEIIVKIFIPDEPVATYKFNSLPLTIGRLDNMDLSICHESIPRELCTIWQKAGSETLGLEVKPGISNSPVINGKKVTTNIFDYFFDMQVGPVRIEIQSADAQKHIEHLKKEKPPVMKFVLYAALLIFAVVFISGNTIGLSNNYGIRPSDFPENLSLNYKISKSEGQNSTPADIKYRAQLIMQRADELISRKTNVAYNQIEAGKMLFKCAYMLKQTDTVLADKVYQKAILLQKKLNHRYKTLIFNLFQHIKNNDAAAVRKTANRLRPYIDSENNLLSRRLDALALQ